MESQGRGGGETHVAIITFILHLRMVTHPSLGKVQVTMSYNIHFWVITDIHMAYIPFIQWSFHTEMLVKLTGSSPLQNLQVTRNIGFCATLGGVGDAKGSV